MNIDKFLEMKPMKYVGGASAKKHVQKFLTEPLTYKKWLNTVKVDGEWARIVYDLDGNVTIQGRGISTKTKQHKDNTESLPQIVEHVKANWPKGTVAIGELSFEDFINHKQTEVGSILRSLPAKALKLQQERGNLHFYIFDCLAYDGEDLTELQFLKRINYGAKLDGDITVALIWHYVSEETLDQLDEVLNAGGEGIMIMNEAGLYLPGSRSVSVSLKIKKELGELTVKVTNFLEPQFAYRGSEVEDWEYKLEDGTPVTKYYFHKWKAGIEFEYGGSRVKATSGISDSDAKWLASDEAQSMLDRGELYADVTAMEAVITDGVPSLRHPVLLKLRTDL